MDYPAHLRRNTRLEKQRLQSQDLEYVCARERVPFYGSTNTFVQHIRKDWATVLQHKLHQQPNKNLLKIHFVSGDNHTPYTPLCLMCGCQELNPGPLEEQPVL